MLRHLFASPAAAVAARAIVAARAPLTRTSVAASSSGIHYIPHEYPHPFLISRNKNGTEIINDPIYNKGTAFPTAERDRLGLRGLVPPRQFSIEEQANRILYRYHNFDSNLAKHSYLNSLHDRNETLFFHVLMHNIKEMAPIIYTPTVGEACIAYGREFRRARGMFISSQDRGQMHAMVYNWPNDHVDVIVVTDGSRILGLGDLGCHGMGIPVGKLALYTAAGGIHPDRVLPITIDVGTDNEALRQDPFYLGLSQPRITGRPYFEILDEFMHAVTCRWPNVVVQFEDFNNKTAEPLLQKYRDKYLCFNDDIQGTGTVTLAGILCALRKKGLTFNDLCNQRIVCLGAGSAGLGVVNSLLYAMTEAGISHEHAVKNFWMVDHEGLLGAERTTLYKSQRVFARSDLPNGMSLADVVKQVKPTILLGLTGAPKTFTEDAIRSMAQHCEQPIIFPLSNPTSRAECTFEDAVKWTNGSVIFASGSPFKPIVYNGVTYTPSQGNNMYIFPGVGLGAVVCQAKHITDRMMYRAAQALASSVKQQELDAGLIFPDLSNIREVSKQVAIAVVEQALEENLVRRPLYELSNLEEAVSDAMYSPEYVPIIRKPEV